MSEYGIVGGIHPSEQDMLLTPEDIQELETLIISAMTNNGEYQVENAGEHATEIANTLLFHGYRKLAKVKQDYEQKRPYKPKNITLADCPVYLQSQGKKWSPYITPDQYPCKECPSSDCKERKRKGLDRPELREIEVILNKLVWEWTHTTAKRGVAMTIATAELLALIPDGEGHTARVVAIALGATDKAWQQKVEEAKKQERERIKDKIDNAFPALVVNSTRKRWDDFWQALKGE